MGAADTVTKAYMRENAIFADAFNYLIYGGRRVIDPNSLKELYAGDHAGGAFRCRRLGWAALAS